MGNKKFLGEVTTPNIITNHRGWGRPAWGCSCM